MNATQGYATHPHHGYMETHHPQMAHGHPHTGAPSYSPYPQTPIMTPSMSTYPQTAPGYHYAYGAPVTTAAHHAGHYSHPMALPTMTQTQAAPPSYAPHTPDTTGQIAPPNHKPKLTGTVWEDEGTVCFQVEVRGICVARREDNCFINGTKLLNVANMTRGRRDGILKSEKTRNVIKIGPMHLKGVWIPFERALEFANKEKITESLYPLFVSNIHPLLAPHFTHLQTGRQRNESQSGQPQTLRTPQSSSAPAPAQLPSNQSMNNSVSNGQSNQPLTAQTPSTSTRPEISRAHTFPTPPTSATSTTGTGQSAAQYNWDQPGSSSVQVDTNINHDVKSLPTTPTTSPPEHPVQSIQYHSSQGYEAPRPVYAAPQQNSQYGTNQGMPGQGYGQMQPPRKNDVVQHDRDFAGHGYAHSGYPYNDGNAPPDLKNSPHNTNSGRTTPRSMGAHQSNWQSGYGTPQRQMPSSNLAYVIGETAQNGYSSYPNGATSSNKRGREPDEDDYSSDLKKRKMGREDSAGLSRPNRSTMIQRQ